MLDLLIGGHSKLASLGEFSMLGKAITLQQPCTCGDLVGSCPAWARVFDAVAAKHNIDLRDAPYGLEDWYARASTVIDHNHQTPLYVAKAKLASLLCDLRFSAPPGSRLGIPLQPRLRSAISNASLLYSAIASSWGKTTLVDSSKNVHKALALHEAMPDKVKILYLTRDGRGVFYSRRTSNFSRAEALSGWYRYNRRAERLLSRHVPERSLLRLRYEEIVGNQEQQAQRICAFLGVEFEPEMLTLKPAQSHMVNGNDMRLKGTQQLKLDERWKTGLVGDDLNWFRKNERGMNARLGYS